MRVDDGKYPTNRASNDRSDILEDAMVLKDTHQRAGSQKVGSEGNETGNEMLKGCPKQGKLEWSGEEGSQGSGLESPVNPLLLSLRASS
jgi:hypothetical protein